MINPHSNHWTMSLVSPIDWGCLFVDLDLSLDLESDTKKCGLFGGVSELKNTRHQG